MEKNMSKSEYLCIIESLHCRAEINKCCKSTVLTKEKGTCYYPLKSRDDRIVFDSLWFKKKKKNLNWKLATQPQNKPFHTDE